MADDAMMRWWDGLSSEDRGRVHALSAGDPLPADLLVSMTRAGMPQAAAWWPSSEAGPTFTVPDELVEFAQDQRTRWRGTDWWDNPPKKP